MEIYQNTLGLLAGRSIEETSDCLVNINRVELLCLAVQTISRFLHHRRKESLQLLLARAGIMDFMSVLLSDAKVVANHSL